MTNNLFLILLLVFGVLLDVSSGVDCDVSGRCINSNFIDATISLNSEDCLEKCYNNKDCQWYILLCHLIVGKLG